MRKKEDQQMVGRRIRKKTTTISKWYTNKIQPDLASFGRIAELLNVNIRELLVNTK